MDKLTISRAHLEDIEVVIALASRIWKPAFSSYFSKKELHNLFEGMYNAQTLHALLTDPYYKLFFIQKAGSNIGYFAVRQNKDHLKLDKIYVDQRFQNQGIGKWIFNKVKYEAVERGYHKIILNVNRRNLPAINFYKNLGFSIIAEKDIAGPNGFIYDDYIMAYIL